LNLWKDIQSKKAFEFFDVRISPLDDWYFNDDVGMLILHFSETYHYESALK
jgi:hypothetical protein